MKYHMGYLFLDIETYVSPDDDTSGLNPFRPASKVLSIAYNYYDGFKVKESEIRKPTILKEWEDGEKKILIKLWDFLRVKLENDEHLKFLGFNILKFDMSYLFGRMQVLEIADNNEMYEVLYRRPHYIDLGQISQVITKNRFKEFLNVSQKTTNRFFNLPIKKGTGKDVSKFYDKKEYDKILDYMNEEFCFELLYQKLRRHVFAKKVNEINDDSSN
jgi:hypothetical protein